VCAAQLQFPLKLVGRARGQHYWK